MNIVQTYFDAMADKGISRKKAIALLNTHCGRSYNYSRMAEFSLGLREPPADAVRFMVRKSISFVLKKSAYDIGTWTDNQIADALTAEPRDD